MRKVITLIFLSLFVQQLSATSPDPPKGKRWVINKTTSDEFNGDTLDLNKWDNTTSRWIGRPPGLFKKESMSVADGHMRLTQSKMDEPEIHKGSTFTHVGGHIISKLKVKPGAYIESSMKANKTFMSSTFWLISYGNENQGCDRRTTELDVQEIVGYSTKGDVSKTERMGSNTHSRGIPSECDIPSGSEGNNTPLGGKGYDRFYTYAVWWKSQDELLFYLDDEYKYTITPVAPFSIEMYIKMVTETYDWNPVPADGGMNYSWEDRTTYYDYTRTYTLIDADAATSLDLGYDDVFIEDMKFGEIPERFNNSDTIEFSGIYKANTLRELHLAIYDETHTLLIEKTYPALRGHGHKGLSLAVNDLLAVGVEYTAEINLRPQNSGDNSNAIAYDEFSFTVSDPVSVAIEVKDENTDQPVEDAEISFSNILKSTDEEGKVNYVEIPIDQYTLEIAAPGYRTLKKEDIAITKDTLISFELAPVLNRIIPVVVDSVTLKPIESATVIINDVQKATDVEGKSTFYLYNGKYFIHLSHPQYGFKKDSISVYGGADVSYFLSRKLTDVEFLVKLDDNLLSQAEVRLGEETKFTAVTGRAMFRDVETNHLLNYRISKDDRLWQEDAVSFYEDTLIQVILSSTPAQTRAIEDFSVYPNPAHTYLNVKGLSETASYRIYNASGELVKKGFIIPAGSVSVKGIPQGVYLLKVEGFPEVVVVKI